jgi:hypothetical protein
VENSNYNGGVRGGEGVVDSIRHYHLGFM